MEALLNNPVAVFWTAVVVITVLPTVTGAVALYWYKTRKAEMDAQLKFKMLELGMSAGDIERVLNAQSPASQDHQTAAE